MTLLLLQSFFLFIATVHLTSLAVENIATDEKGYHIVRYKLHNHILSIRLEIERIVHFQLS